MSGDRHEAYDDAVADLTELSVGITEPSDDRVRSSGTTPEAGSPAFYSTTTDSIVLHEAGYDATKRAAEHELVHYSQAREGLGQTDAELERGRAALSGVYDTVVEEDPELAEGLFSGAGVVEDDDVEIAAALYVSEADTAAICEHLEPGMDVDDVLGTVHDGSEEYAERFQGAIAPFAQRKELVGQLPLETEGEADAYFWNMFRHAAGDEDTPEAADLSEQLYDGWDEDDRTSIAETFEQYPDPTAVLDGVEHRIEQYRQRVEGGEDPEEAAAGIVNEGLERFRETGDQLGIRSPEEYVAVVEEDDYTGFTGDALHDLLREADQYRELLLAFDEAAEMAESAYRGLVRDRTTAEVDDDEDLPARIEEAERDLEVADEMVRERLEDVGRHADRPPREAVTEGVETLVTAYVAVLDEHEHRRDDIDADWAEEPVGRRLITRLRRSGDNDTAKSPFEDPVPSYITEDRAEDDDRFELVLGEKGMMGLIDGLVEGRSVDEIYSTTADGAVPDEERDRVVLEDRMEDSDLPPGYVKWLYHNEDEDVPEAGTADEESVNPMFQ